VTAEADHRKALVPHLDLERAARRDVGDEPIEPLRGERLWRAIVF
jgi:hypothetical protein